MKSSSLTKQAGFLMAGRFLSMPLAFLVPVVLARNFSLEEFGNYKQLFLVFNVLLPIIDFGIINSLYYFIPRYPQEKNTVIGQTLILTGCLCVAILICFSFFPGNISELFTNNNNLGQFIFLLGVFAVSWHLSNLLEVVLIVEKKAAGAGIVTFLSETARSVASISVVLLGLGLEELLIALVCVGICRCFIMAYYLFRNYEIDFSFRLPLAKRLMRYSIPFGGAVIVSGFVGNVHQYIVSINTNSSEFAIFAVGCFQLPLLMVVVDSIAKTSLVRMAELRNHQDGFREIALIISNSCRKLWLLFFPMFVFLFITAEEFIQILFTEQYLDSVPIFRIFIFMIPISAILIQHVPRALNKTNFILINNVFVLLLSILLCWVGQYYLGGVGAAMGFIAAQLVWRIVFLLKCSKLLGVALEELLPSQAMARSAGILIIGGTVAYFAKLLGSESVLLSFCLAFSSFALFCFISYRYLGVLATEEIRGIFDLINTCKSRMPLLF